MLNRKHFILHSFSSKIKNAKKLFTKVFLLLTAVLLLFCTAACTSRRTKLNRIAPDITYDYVMFNRDYLIINGTHYDVNDLAYRVSKKKNQGYIYRSVLIGNSLYYIYEYSNKKSVFGAAENNTHKFGVALFTTNVETTETELIYDFKNVIPRGYYQYTYPDVWQIIDDDTFVFSYNGDLSVFDIKTRTITETLNFYDKEIFKNLEYQDIHFKNSGDCYYHLGDGILRYAEFKNGHYRDHTFKVDKDSNYISRFENYIYTSGYVGDSDEKYKYYNCYDLETEEEKDREFLTEIVEKDNLRKEQEEHNRQEDPPKEKSITVGGKTYHYACDDNDRITIADETGETIYEIDSKYASANNPKFAKFFGVYFSNPDALDADVSVNTFDNRIFISFSRNYMMWGRTAQMIFEFDIESGNLYYLTYAWGDFYFYSINGKIIGA